MTDLDELERLLEQATPGPWEHVTNAPNGDYAAIWHEHYVYAPKARYASLPGNPSPVKVAYMPQAPDKRPAHDAALIAALRNAAEELVRDARRWRHAKSVAMIDIHGGFVIFPDEDPFGGSVAGSAMEKQIDAAIAQEQP
jgi:hypothetical protein